jgi:hypothetical protein
MSSWNRLQLRKQGIGDQHHSRLSVIENVFVLGRLEQSVGGDRYGADLNGPEEDIEKFGAIPQDQHDSFPRPNLELAQEVTRPVRPLQQLLVTDKLVTAFQSGFDAASFADIAIHKMRGGVKNCGKGNQGSLVFHTGRK